MAYRVELTLRAERDLEELYLRIHAGDSLAATRWFNGLERAILSLERLPRRCPPAPEAARSRRELRHLLYGRKPHIYRVLFEINEPRGAVRVLTIRHGARDKFMPGKQGVV